MPADAWAIPFAVGKRSQPDAASAPRDDNSGTRDPRLLGHMAGQGLGRIDDSLLVREAQRGNRAAFEELVRHYDQAVLRLAMHLTGSEHEAQDIYQEAFLKAYKSVGNFRFECSFYTWIYRIVTNLCLDHLRKRQVRKEDAPVATDASGEPYDVIDRVPDGRSGANPERRFDAARVGKPDFPRTAKIDAARADGFRAEALPRTQVADRGRSFEYNGGNRQEHFVPRNPEITRRAGGHAMTNQSLPYEGARL